MRDTILTFVLTIIGGISIFVLGQIFLKAFIDPILQLRAFKGTIADSLVYYSDIYFNPSINKEEDAIKASKRLRGLGSELMAKTTVVPVYSLWSYLGFVPIMSDILSVNRNLIGLSHGVFGGDPQLSVKQVEGNTKRIEEIKAALRLPNELLR